MPPTVSLLSATDIGDARRFSQRSDMLYFFTALLLGLVRVLTCITCAGEGGADKGQALRDRLCWRQWRRQVAASVCGLKLLVYAAFSC